MSDFDWENDRRARRPRRRREDDVPYDAAWLPPVLHEAPVRSTPPRAAQRGPDTEAEGIVTKFDAARGFGFLALDDGRAAFLHIFVLNRAGMDVPALGIRLHVRVSASSKGPQVSEVIGAMTSTAAANMNESVPGIVKFYDAEKGFGFVKFKDGRPDVFFHATILHRIGLQEIKNRQPVRITVTQGRKGLQVETLTLA